MDAKRGSAASYADQETQRLPLLGMRGGAEAYRLRYRLVCDYAIGHEEILARTVTRIGTRLLMPGTPRCVLLEQCLLEWPHADLR